MKMPQELPTIKMVSLEDANMEKIYGGLAYSKTDISQATNWGLAFTTWLNQSFLQFNHDLVPHIPQR